MKNVKTFLATLAFVGLGVSSAIAQDVYPNPTNGKIIVASDKVYKVESIVIYDVVGRKLLSHTPLTSHSSPLIEIDISHLANGLYFLKIDNKMIKVVKQ
ncbi:MAG: T9SS type A sorting domain-containing protein [Lentimicrobiaceae bacterium]|nr:T9SS type A sorting domain-containing protein [Lentimicrobiaceae bacterium]